MRPAGHRQARRLARLLSRISIRLLAFNVLLVFLPAAGLLTLDTYERQLLAAQERSLVQQGRLLAAALSGRGDLDAGEARRVLVQLNRRLDARLRVADRDGRLLADSSALGPRREAAGDDAAAPTTPTSSTAQTPPPPTPAPGDLRASLLYRLGSGLNRLYRAVRPAPELPAAETGLYDAGGDGRLAGPAVRQALAGRYGADLRVSAAAGATANARAVTTLYSAIPVTGGEGGEGGDTGVGGVVGAGGIGGIGGDDRGVVGAVLVSQSTGRTLDALQEVRLAIFRVFLLSVGAAVVLSLVTATTIARPLRRLRDRAAAILDRRGRLTGRFPPSRKLDEIGDLARALEELTRRLEERMRATEAFAADVSHEFRNPLASIRTAAELLAETGEPADQRRFRAMILREVARLESLLSGVREIALIDAGMSGEPSRPVALNELLTAVVEGFRLRQGGEAGNARGAGEVAIDLALPAATLAVHASADRISQVVENLLDNAVGFSHAAHAAHAADTAGATDPPRVVVELAREDGAAVVAVSDRGPGIPAEHRARIFDRFFTWRAAAGGDGGRRGEHTGLGLAIAKAIVESYGGSIRAADRPGGGARFEVRLPLETSREDP